VQNKYIFQGGGTLTVEIPELKKGTQPFSRAIPVTSTAVQTVNLSGYILTPAAGGKEVTVKYTYKNNGFTLPGTGIELGFDLSISNAAIGEARGYFGHYTEYARQTIDIGDFDDFNGSLKLKEASIVLDIRNTIEIPFRMVIDTIRSYTDLTPGAPPAVERVQVDSLTLGTAAATVDTLTIPGEVLNVLPKKMEVTVKVQSNPDGKTGTDNVIRSANSASASAKVLVPMKVKDINITLTDTVDFNTSDISFNNVGLLLNVRNGLPLGVTLQCTLLEKESNRSLGNLFDTPVEIPAGITTPVGNGESEVTSPSETQKFITVRDDMSAKLKDSDRIIVSLTAFTGDTSGAYVRIKKDNCVSLKIGVSAGINVGDLKDRL
jgi:hypothetical protein